jgi:Ca2+-binding RTX toxin-like protein
LSGGGHDSLIGGLDREVLFGGTPNDVFQFASNVGRHQITDFAVDDDLPFSPAAAVKFPALPAHMADIDPDTTVFDAKVAASIDHVLGLHPMPSDFLFC